MAKFQSPLLGYNNNVRHRGRVFHIQTEDSGVNHPHIITHLFMDGGRILKSVKKSYAEHVGTDNMSETVRVMMKEQHKAMFIALRDGQFDALVDGGDKKRPVGDHGARPSGPELAPVVPTAAATPTATAQAAAAAKTNEPAPPREGNEGSVVVGQAPAAAAPARAVEDVAPAKTASNEIPVVPEPSAVTTPDPRKVLHDTASAGPEEAAPATIDESSRAVAIGADPPLPPELEALLRDELPPPDPPTDPTGGLAETALDDAEPATTREPSKHISAHELTLDFDALERDSAVSPSFQQPGDLPPPPKSLFAKEPRTGTYSAVDADGRQNEPHGSAARPATPSARPPTQPPAARQGSAMPRRPSEKPASDGRHAPAGPAAISNGAPKQASPASIFSDDLVSDKSLDEVILSYLAEDLDPPRRK
jgi:hypothetical protein